MEYKQLHEWPTTKPDAIAIQNEMADKVELHGNFIDVRLIAAVDTAYGKNGEILCASAVVTTFPEIEEVEQSFHYGPAVFPYIPGLFYFREGPIIVNALEKIKSDPDVIIVHGHGIAHPRRCGMACHIGIAFDKPAIGCARKLLTGYHRPIAPAKGSFQPITSRSKEVGVAYRSKDNVKPIFVSPGHKCDMAQAREIVVKNLRGFRLPEPLRLAHLMANKYKRHVERNREIQTDS